MNKKRISPWSVLFFLGLLLAASLGAMALLSPPAAPAVEAQGVRAVAPSPRSPAAFGTTDSGPGRILEAPGDGTRELPKVAIILDDMGGNLEMVKQVKMLRGSRLTVSILPFLEYTREAATELDAAGFEILLHLPMEPLSYPRHDPGKGAIFVSMTPEATVLRVKACLDQVPGAVGVNNHMGSRATLDRPTMGTVMRVLRARSLFFIDSMTHQGSIAADVARSYRVPTARRAVFLDNDNSEASIRRQLDALVRRARRDGKAVGIGHGRPATVRVLRAWLPQGRTDGRFRLAFASEVVQ
jgi:polysaccharide deacetylase 2 family uncharacterized protein YibQ